MKNRIQIFLSKLFSLEELENVWKPYYITMVGMIIAMCLNTFLIKSSILGLVFGWMWVFFITFSMALLGVIVVSVFVHIHKAMTEAYTQMQHAKQNENQNSVQNSDS